MAPPPALPAGPTRPGTHGSHPGHPCGQPGHIRSAPGVGGAANGSRHRLLLARGWPGGCARRACRRRVDAHPAGPPPAGLPGPRATRLRRRCAQPPLGGRLDPALHRGSLALLGHGARRVFPRGGGPGHGRAAYSRAGYRHQAVWNRRPRGELVHPSDRGAQYTSVAFSRRLEAAGVLGSMGSVGDALDKPFLPSLLADRQPGARILWKHGNIAYSLASSGFCERCCASAGSG